METGDWVNLGLGIITSFVLPVIFFTARAIGAKFEKAEQEVNAKLDAVRDENTRDHAMVRERLDDLKGDVSHLNNKVDEGLTRVHERMNEHLLFHATNGEMPSTRRGRPRKTAS